jgi:3-hydroxybutyryl-CoA dehydrogenase
VSGPRGHSDLVGADLTLIIRLTALPGIGHRPGPFPSPERLVADGKLGFKSGEGFRKWTAEQRAALPAKIVQHLKDARADDA